MSHLHCCTACACTSADLFVFKTVLRALRVLTMELLPPALRDRCLQVCCSISVSACMGTTHSTVLYTPSADSEGTEGLNVFYWSKFSAPDGVALEIRGSSPERLQRRLPGSNKVLRDSRYEQRYYMERDDDMLHLLGKDCAQTVLKAKVKAK